MPLMDSARRVFVRRMCPPIGIAATYEWANARLGRSHDGGHGDRWGYQPFAVRGRLNAWVPMNLNALPSGALRVIDITAKIREIGAG
jgi:hypothetical protein